MNNALVFHAQLTLKNMVKQSLKKPLKLIGIIALTGYFLFLPMILKTTITQVGFDNPAGFVLMTTGFSFYISMPSTLSYFKRKGVIFRKQDVHFMFSTPQSPKAILVYALFKQAYLTLIMQIVLMIAAIFVFRIPVFTALIYGIGNLVFSSLLQYSLAVVMYGSEDLTTGHKKMIKYVVYLILALLTLFVIIFTWAQGFSLESFTRLATHPVVLLIPVFGWELGWLNLMMFGANWATILSTVLFISSALGLAYYAYTMRCTGEYYEDALAFSENLAVMEAKKGNVSFSEALGKKRKIHKVTGAINGTGAQVIFSKQILEKRRTSKFFIGFGDVFYLAVGIGLGVMNIIMTDKIPTEMFFTIIVGVTMYMMLFFSPAPTWKSDFEHPTLYIIPDSITRKLIYATMLDHCIAFMRAVFLTVPSGLLIGVSIGDIILAVLAQVLLRMMVTYVSVLTRDFVSAKFGNVFGQFVNILITVIVLIVPGICLALSAVFSTFMGFVLIAAYSLLVSGLSLYISGKTLTNIESLKA